VKSTARERTWNHPLVQILVVVARTLERVQWVDVGKGFSRSAIRRESVGPKEELNRR